MTSKTTNFGCLTAHSSTTKRLNDMATSSWSERVSSSKTNDSRITNTVAIRTYERSDATDTLTIFTEAITGTASGDYTPEQIRAWAKPGQRDLSTWHAAMETRNSIVATVDDAVVGFSDNDATGYIDMMFVSPRHIRRGVATRLLAYVERRARIAGFRELTADVSITARPFFERFGFEVVAEQHPVKDGVELTNYAMRKVLTERAT
jgi:putative acetyltransferase